MNRRSFLASILAAGAAPVFLRSSSAAGLFLPRDSGITKYAYTYENNYGAQAFVDAADWSEANSSKIITLKFFDELRGLIAESDLKPIMLTRVSEEVWETITA